jgi:hypothetical protein
MKRLIGFLNYDGSAGKVNLHVVSSEGFTGTPVVGVAGDGNISISFPGYSFNLNKVFCVISENKVNSEIYFGAQNTGADIRVTCQVDGSIMNQYYNSTGIQITEFD